MRKAITLFTFFVIYITSFAQLTKAPYLIYTGNLETMKVMFQAEKPQVYFVYYGQTKEYEIGGAKISQQKKGKNENIFTYTFKYLKPNTKYYYKVSDKHHKEQYFGSFYSAKAPTDKKVYFSVVGNTSLNKTKGINDSLFKAILNFNKKAKKSSFLTLHTGNFIKKGNSEKSWYSVLFKNKSVCTFLANMPIILTKGVDEAKKCTFAKDKKLFRKYFKYKYHSDNACYYSFKYGHIKFIVLDQFVDFSLGSEQFKWLKKELKTDISNPKVILMHSIFTTKKSISVFDKLNPLFEKHNVKIVFTSDANGYLHSKIGKLNYFSLGRKDFSTKKQNNKIQIIKSLKGDFFINVKYESVNIIITILDKNLKIIDKFEFK